MTSSPFTSTGFSRPAATTRPLTASTYATSLIVCCAIDGAAPRPAVKTVARTTVALITLAGIIGQTPGSRSRGTVGCRRRLLRQLPDHPIRQLSGNLSRTRVLACDGHHEMSHLDDASEPVHTT